MKKFLVYGSFIFLLIHGVTRAYQDKDIKDNPKVDQKKVDEALQKKIDEAIDKGMKYLLDYSKKEILPKLNEGVKAFGWQFNMDPRFYTELIVLTLVHAGVSKEDETFKALLNDVLSRNLVLTYHVALQAMALEALDKKTYQKRIAECAQFLIDAQDKDGRWGYMGGQPTKDDDVATDKGKGDKTKKDKEKDKPVETIGPPKDPKKGGDTEALPIMELRKRGWGFGTDNSNTQYATLGLRACMDSGIAIPKDVAKLAVQWWEKNQNADGGWGYGGGKGSSTGLLSDISYGSMTAGGVGSLAIYKYYLGQDYKKEKHIQAGLKWLADHYSIKANPPFNNAHLYYYLYALERAGIFTENEKIGSHSWYIEGAQYLIQVQNGDGSWDSQSELARKMNPHQLRIADTCFAILFLKRATKPLKLMETEK